MTDIFDRSVHPLYAVCAFVSALVVGLILNSSRKNIYVKNKDHERLLYWVIFFCIQDGIWGLFASHVFNNPTMLFVASTVFHFSAITSTLVWVQYFLLRAKANNKKIYTIVTCAMAFAQYIMLLVNIKTKFMFYIDADGWYCTTDYRQIMFYMQTSIYVLMTIVTLSSYFLGNSKEKKENLMPILAVNSAPTMFSIFQMIYPDAPSDSLGFSIGVLIIYTYLMIDYERQVTALQELRSQLNVALDSAEKANKTKTAFLFNMSHDIRTPMNAIIGFADIAEKHIDEKERVKDSISKIKNASAQLLDIINDILEMSRIDSGKLEIILSPVDLSKVIENDINMYELLAIGKSISFNCKTEEFKDKYVYADASHFNRIVTNVVTNAIKYTPEGGKVNLSFSETGSKDGIGTYRIVVSDNGIGMSEEFMEHLFEQFSRERTSTASKQQGTGLGLAIVKQIVDALGGEISVDSKQGEGTTFTIDIPFRIETEEEIVQNHKTINTDDKVDFFQEFAGEKILLVEDNEMNREIASDILMDAGFEVDVATDGKFAVDMVTEKGVDYYEYILMDIQMPTMNGYEATKRIRNMPNGQEAVIIALSANAFEEDKKKSIESGMNDHIAKPININQLFETLKENKKITINK